MEGRPLLVTAAMIERDGKLLIAQRLPSSRFEPSKWEFPGGKVDFGEHPKDSLKRELLEELGVEVDVHDLYSLASHVYDQNGLKRHVVVLFYRCSIVTGEPTPLDCQDIKWVNREELDSFPYVDGDVGIVRELLNDHEFWS